MKMALVEVKFDARGKPVPHTLPEEKVGTLLYVEHRDLGRKYSRKGFYQVASVWSSEGLYLRNVAIVSSHTNCLDSSLLSAFKGKFLKGHLWRYAEEWEYLYAI